MGQEPEPVTLKIMHFHFAAVMLTALALAPGLAHLFALPNKISLAQEPYFVVQGIYRGWALLGIVLFAALFANAILTYLLGRAGEPTVLPLIATFCLAFNIAIFFIWTFPANQATDNWTTVPENWMALRTQWEYSHAVNAGLTFVALCATAWSAVSVRVG
jgi:hypothetical protein